MPRLPAEDASYLDGSKHHYIRGRAADSGAAGGSVSATLPASSFSADGRLIFRALERTFGWHLCVTALYAGEPI